MTTLKWSVLLAAALIAGCANHPAADSAANANIEADQLVMQIKNADVRWDGDYFGLKPTLTGNSEKLLQIRSQQVTPALLKALKDDQRFVAAHVLLTAISGQQMQRDAESWNGLRVNLLANGQTVIPEGQQAALIQKWTAWRRSKM